jgi:hypothetical protein|nr:MAG TPA: peptidase [Caudoviricetes sp.]
MNIPKKIKALHLEYEVIEDRNIHEGDAELFGQIQYIPQRILLNEQTSHTQKCETLIHEVIHALDNVYNIGLEEKQVEQLGVAIYNFIEDNKVVLFDNNLQ